ncbi:MAG: helix-turn-helix domain-containing protein [Velocimicrobium sp.]
MGTSPTKAASNIYCRCRKEAAKYNDKINSREGAAEQLGISASTLADYELDITKIIPANNILRMADLYNAPELKNHYCREVCPLGRNVPEVSLSDLDRISIQALSSFRKISATKENLLDIVADGKISEDEKPQLTEILENLDELNAVSQSLKVWIEKNL